MSHLRYGELTMDGDGTVWMDPLDDGPNPIYIGHIEEACPDFHYQRAWTWFGAEFDDMRRHAAGYCDAVNHGYEGRIGSPR